jgi:hypothetical protein
MAGLIFMVQTTFVPPLSIPLVFMSVTAQQQKGFEVKNKGRSETDALLQASGYVDEHVTFMLIISSPHYGNSTPQRCQSQATSTIISDALVHITLGTLWLTACAPNTELNLHKCAIGDNARKPKNSVQSEVNAKFWALKLQGLSNV